MLDQEAQTQKLVKVKFVDTQDYYTDFVTNQKTQYPDREPQFDENGYQTNYCLPEAFTWDRGGATERELPGYWISKYEISDMDLDVEFFFSMNKNSITIEKVDTSKAYMSPAIYDIYLDGELLSNISSFPYTISGLEPNREYRISAVAKTSTGETIGNIEEELVKTLEKDMSELTVPDLTGYNKEKTFYVKYNGDMIESENIPINQAAPSNWYDYNNNKWANIVTVNENISNNKEVFENAKAYWVWIPRYEYKPKGRFSEVQIRFISKEQTTPTEGYTIPDAFTWDGKQLSGYWVSKYEIAEPNADKGQFYFTSENNAIGIQSVKIYDSSASAATKYDIYVNNVLKAQDVTIPYTITGLETNTEYRIKAVAKTSDGKKIGMIQEECVKTNQADISTIISPDLTGFNTATTYYVTYDDSGNETRTPITSAAPSDWYDYNNNKWANIVTSNNGKEAYFVWIPRYEYKPKDRFSQVQIRFITKDVTTPTTGWKIPDAFTWDGSPISGYWVSKYEISESE